MGNKSISDDEWLKRFRSTHGNRYNYFNIHNIRGNSKIDIICPEHGKFSQVAKYHWQGNACPECSKINRVNKRKMSIDEFVQKAKIKHNSKYDYTKMEYINYRTKVCIICPIHGEFWQTPCNHLLYGCRKCAAKDRNKPMSQEEFIKKANAVHNNKYDYSKSIYLNSENKIIITCPIHGDFTQNAGSHIRGIGCPKCGKEKASSKTRNTTSDFINKAIKVFGDAYDYSNVKYVNSKTPVCIICKKHGAFYQIPNTHLLGHGCPKCAKRNS